MPELSSYTALSMVSQQRGILGDSNSLLHFSYCTQVNAIQRFVLRVEFRLEDLVLCSQNSAHRLQYYYILLLLVLLLLLYFTIIMEITCMHYTRGYCRNGFDSAINVSVSLKIEN